MVKNITTYNVTKASLKRWVLKKVKIRKITHEIHCLMIIFMFYNDYNKAHKI